MSWKPKFTRRRFVGDVGAAGGGATRPCRNPQRDRQFRHGSNVSTFARPYRFVQTLELDFNFTRALHTHNLLKPGLFATARLLLAHEGRRPPLRLFYLLKEPIS